MIDESLCEGCPIYGEHEPFLGTDGDESAPYLIVTDVPSKAAVRRGVMLPNTHLQMLEKHLEAEGFDPRDFRTIPACRCPYDKEAYKTKVKKQINRHCRRHLEDYIEADLPQVIVTLGADATAQVMNKPSVKITKVRGLAHMSEEFGVPVFPMQAVSLAVNYPQNEPLLAADVASLGRLADAEFDIDRADDFSTGRYEIVKDLQFLIDEDPEIVAFDTETTGLRWYQKGVDVRGYKKELHEGMPWYKPRFQILTMQFTTREGTAYILPWDHPEDPIPEHDKPRLRNQLRKLLCADHRIVVGQRLKFDNVALWKTEGIRFRIGGCTGMLAAIVDENLPEKNLDVLTKIYVPAMAGYADRFNQTVQKDRMWETNLRELAQYGGGDTDASYRLYHVLEEKVMEDDGLWNHYTQVSLPGLNAMARLETNGMLVDMEDAMPKFQAYMEQEVEAQRLSLLSQLDRRLKQDVLREYTSKPANRNKGAEDALNFGRSDFLKEVLFNHPNGFRLKPVVFTKTTAKLKDESLREPSTSSKDHLPFFFDVCPFTMELAQYVKDRRMLDTNILGFQEKFVQDGMVRPTYYLDVAVTRRTASRDPNGQNFPKRGKKAKMYQKAFVAPPGWAVISCVAKGERVETERGAIPIEEVRAGDAVRGLDGKFYSVSHAMRTGQNRDVVRITASSGRSVRVTPCHRMTVLRGETILDLRADELRDTDYLLTDNEAIPDYTAGGIEQDDAYWLGQFLGDGYAGCRDTLQVVEGAEYSYRKKYVAFAFGKDVEEQCKRLRQYTLRRFGVSPVICGRKGDVRVHGAAAYAHFYGLTGKDGSHSIRVPDAVWRSGAQVRSQFLAGMLDSDGSIHSRRATISSVSEGMVDDLLELAASIGVFGVKRKTRIKNGYKTSTEFCYSFVVFAAGSLARMSSRLSRKAEALAQLASSKGYTQCRTEFVPAALVESWKTPGVQSAAQANKLFTNTRRTGRATRDAVARAALVCPALADPSNGALRYRYDRVVTVARDGQADVYDLTVPEGSHFTTRGFKNHNCDLSQAELRIAGEMAGEREFIRIYRNNGDIHISTACIALGITEEKFRQLPEAERKDWRQKAKAINFGFIYGMSWRKFMIYAKTQYGVEFTEKEAKRIRANFFTKYSGLEKWHKKTRAYVMQHGQIRSFSGLIRHLPTVWSEEEYIQAEAIRQAINSPVQEFGSTLGVMALGRMDEQINPEYMQLIGFIHDAIYAYVREEHVDWGLKTLKGFMESNPLEETFGLNMRIPIVADASFGWNQGELFELDGFKVDVPYDFWGMTDKDGTPLLPDFPEQVVPPNGGMLDRPPYTTDQDLEDEDVEIVTSQRRRSRLVGASVKAKPTATELRARSGAVKRVARTR